MTALLFLLSSVALATPDRAGYVTDIPDMIPAENEAAMEAKLQEYHEATGFDVEILVVDSLDGMTAAEYATTARREWEVGGTENAGVLYLVGTEAIKKAHISTGPVARRYLSDARATAIVTKISKPYNERGERVEAIEVGTDAILSTIGDTPLADRPTPPTPTQSESPVSDEEYLSDFACALAGIGLLGILFIGWLFLRGNGPSRGGARYRGGNSGRYSGSGGYYSSSHVYIDNSSSWSGGGGSSSDSGSSSSGSDGGGGGGGDSG